MPNAQITGFGMYTPSRTVTNHDLANRIDTSDAWIQERTGIKQRNIVSEREYCSQMAVDASKQALADAGINAGALDLIIVASSSPDYLTPPVSSQVQHLLGAGKIPAFTVVVGCTGFVTALITAEQFIKTGSYQTILVIGVELISRMIDWKDRNTCVIFGDGAGAVVIQATNKPVGLLSHVMGSDGSGYSHIILPAGGSTKPNDESTLSNGENYLRMNGREVFKFASVVITEAMHHLLTTSNKLISDIDLFIPHQANARIVEYAAHEMGLSMDKVFLNIHKYGNTSAASVPIAMYEAYSEKRIRENSLVALIAFGAGLTWAGALWKF